jgi:hypothetical protein
MNLHLGAISPAGVAASERAVFGAVLVGCVALPVAFGWSQPLVGTLVNALLVFAALHVRSWSRILVIAVLPSLVAVGGGWVLGSGEHAPWAALPVIWAGNLLLVWALKSLHLGLRERFSMALAYAATGKAALIGGGLTLLLLAGMVSAAGLGLLIILQAATAFLGGALGWGASRLYLRGLRA